MKDLQGREMYLSAVAEAAARRIADVGGQFTSGHRDLRQQAHAMAVNTALNRQWVGQTYRQGAPVQAWLNANLDAVTIEDLAEGIYCVMAALPPDRQLSHHLLMPCPCFDVQPQAGAIGEQIRRAILSLPGLVQFLDREGGLLRWHAEFAELPSVKM